MSYESQTLVIALPSPAAPADLSSKAAVLALFEPLYNQDFPDKEHRYLNGRSRKCWFEWVFSEILILTGIEGLFCLSGQSFSTRFVEGDWEILVSRIDGEQLGQLIVLLQRVMDWCMDNPGEIENIIGAGYSPDEIREFFLASQAVWDANACSDDGDNPEYLYSLLKQVLAICVYARGHGMEVLYLIEQPAGGGAVTKEEKLAGRARWQEKWRALLGEELGPETCQQDECKRLHIKTSVMCRLHHYEMTRKEKWPHGDFPL